MFSINSVVFPEYFLKYCFVFQMFQKMFIDEVKKAIASHHGGSKQMIEGAAITCVRLCKASTYISINDRLNVLFTFVQSIINDLKVCTFLENF